MLPRLGTECSRLAVGDVLVSSGYCDSVLTAVNVTFKTILKFRELHPNF